MQVVVVDFPHCILFHCIDISLVIYPLLLLMGLWIISEFGLLNFFCFGTFWYIYPGVYIIEYSKQILCQLYAFQIYSPSVACCNFFGYN